MTDSEISPPEITAEWLPLSSTENDVLIKKDYAATGGLPVIKFGLVSHRYDAVAIKLREPVPVDFSVESIHRPDKAETPTHSGNWSKHPAGSYLEYECRLGSGASVTTGVGLETDSPEEIKQFLTTDPQILNVTPVSDTTDSSTPAETSGSSAAASGERPTDTPPEHPRIAAAPQRDFSDVAGLYDVKTELRDEVIEPFNDPAFEQYDIGKVNGVLLYGPPGTGKTYLAEALAGELGYYYMPLDTADIVSTTVGESVTRLNEYFEAARDHQPCVMFFDEIDAITADRSSRNMTQHQRQAVNTMLEAVADINDNDEDLLVVAATNKPDQIDAAMKRTGRFDTTIKIGLPDADTRLAILDHHLTTRGPPVGDFLIDSTFVDEFATDSEGLAASAITEIAERAQRAAIRNVSESPRVQAAHVREALTDVQGKHDQDVAGEFITETPDIDFDDVGGMDDIKHELEDTVIQALEHPDRYEEHGLDPPTGILLYGPPGTGKTYLSRALAGEAGVTFLSVSGSDVLSKWVGQAAENVRELIDRATAAQPCILFIDELDAIASRRSSSMTQSETSMINELLAGLSELDDEDVIVIATTNRPDQLDDAILRSGRMDRRIEVPPPDEHTRIEILKTQLRNRPVDTEDLDWAELGQQTAPSEYQAPLVASDLSHIVNEAARTALDEATDTELQPIEHRHLVTAITDAESSLAGPTD
jgi:SpoVK/Ycf46/Vps4 family AAA+-type ATPase